MKSHPSRSSIRNTK